MTIVEEPGFSVDPKLVRWGGYGVCAIGLVVGTFDRFVPSQVALAAALAAAVIAPAFMLLAPNLFEVTSRRSRARAINPIFCLPAVGLCIIVFRASYLDMLWIWQPIVAAGVVGLALGFASGRAFKVGGPRSLTVFTGFVAVASVFGGVLAADVQFDPSPGQMFQVDVVGKHETHGRSTLYYLELPPWGPVTTSDSIDVEPELYNALNPGDMVCLNLHPGLFGGAWFVPGLCTSGQTAPVPNFNFAP